MMEDFGTAAPTKAALLLIIGEPVTEDHKHLIPEELAKGFRTWDAEAAGIDINEEVSQIANKGALGEEGPYGERVLRYSSETFSVEALIAPQTTTVKRSLKNFLGAPVKYHHLIYAGHVLHGSGEWILQDAPFSFSSFAATLKDPDVENALKQQEEGLLNIHCFATGEWNNANLSKIGSKVLQINLNPEDKLTDLTGVLQFSTYLCNYVKCRSLKEMLRSSDVVGNIRFSKPTLYVFPGCQGDSALFGISGFNLLVNGGYNKKACFWDFTRHLDRIDALLLTHLGIDNLFGINSVLHRKSIENVHPEIGHVYFNAPKGIRNSQDESELDGKPSVDSLLINLSNEGDRITEYVRQLGQVVNSCYRPATCTQVDPVNLYHKVGHGSLDMYIMNPVQDSKELKEFFQQWSKQSIQVNGSSCPLPNMLSICALLIWRPADPAEKITRLFFPGNAPQHKIIEGLEKMKTLNVLKYPKCCDKDLNAPKTAVKKSAAAGAPLRASRPTTKTVPSKSEPIKRESKVEVKSRPPLTKSTTNKGLKDDNNKKASKAKEKGDKPKSSNGSSPKISPPTEVAPSAQSPLDGVPAMIEPVVAPIVKESPPDLVQKDSNLLADFGNTSVAPPASSPASDPLLDLIGHSSMKAESEQLMNFNSPLLNNQSPEPLPDPSHVERDAIAEPEVDQLRNNLSTKNLEDLGIYEDEFNPPHRTDDAIEADKIVSSSSEDKGFDEMEEVQPESLPEPDLVLESQPIQYDDSRLGFSEKEPKDIGADLLQKPNTLLDGEITPQTAAPVEASPETELSPGMPMDSCMSTSMYGSLMEPALPSQAEVLQNLQDDISEEKTKDDSISEDCSEIKENQLMSECEELSEKPQDLPVDEPSSGGLSGRSSPELQKQDMELEAQNQYAEHKPVDSLNNQMEAGFEDEYQRTGSPSFEGQHDGIDSPSFEDQRQGTESPSFEDQRQGTESPSFEGQRQGTESPSFEGQRQGTESPSFEAQRQGTESPSFEGQRQGTESPSFEGQRQGTESPAFEGQRQGTESPSFEGQRQGTESPSFEGQRSDTESPSFEGQHAAPESLSLANHHGDAESPVDDREHSDAESPEYSREHSGTESPEFERHHGGVESTIYEEQHDGSESPEREHHGGQAYDEEHREEVEDSPEPEEQGGSSDDQMSDRVSPDSNDGEEMHGDQLDKRCSPEGYEADQSLVKSEFQEKDEDKENDGPASSGLHQSDSGTALDHSDEGEQEEDEDSSEVASQPETNERIMDWDDKQGPQDHTADLLGGGGDGEGTEKDEIPQHDGDDDKMDSMKVPQSNSGDFSSDDGKTAAKEADDRDDTDSIDGGTPDDEKDIDESLNSSKQSAAGGWNSTAASNLSPLAPPFAPSTQQSFDPFSPQGDIPYTGGHAAPNLDGLNADAKPFEPADEWGKPMNLPSPPPPPDSRKTNGVTAAKSSTTMRSRPANPKLDSKSPDKKLADNKKADLKKPATLTKSKSLSERKTTASSSTSRPERKMANGDSDVKSKPKTSASSLDKRPTSAITERKPLTKSRSLSAASSKPETKTSSSLLKTDSKTKLSATKRPATTTGSRVSPASKPAPPLPPHTTFYVDLTYIPNHGDPSSSDIEFFKRIRARYYVLSALSPNPQILNALLEAKQSWEDKELEVTVIPTYDNETLRHWMGLHRDQLTDLKIDVAPSASRCTIQLQDHETSCSAYRLEF